MASLLNIFTGRYEASETSTAQENSERSRAITKLLSDQEIHEFEIPIQNTKNQLTASYIAGICLLDLVQNKAWCDSVFYLEPELSKQICLFLLKTAFAEYPLKNVQAKIVAKTLITLYYSNSIGN